MCSVFTRSTLCTGSSRPRSAASSRSRFHCFASRSAPVPTGIQPSARSTSRRSARGLLAGSRIGSGPFGLGPTSDGAMVVSSPSYATGSGPHTARQTSISSSRTFPRRSNGATAAAAYSSSDQPVPRPATTRPPLAASSEASWRASWNGTCSGATSTLVPSRARRVAPAASASVTSGSATERYWSGQGSPGMPYRPWVAGSGNRIRSKTHRL